MAALDTGNSSAGKANVNANYQLEVNLPRTDTQAGYATLLSEIDDGTAISGGARSVKALEVTDDFRLRVGQDTLLFALQFEGTNIARDRIQQNDTTATSAQASGYLTLNSGSSVTTGQGSNIRTYRTFPVFGSSSTYAEFWAREVNHDTTNSLAEWGFGYCSDVTAQLTDGAFFRRLPGGTLRCVVTNNSTDVLTGDVDPANIPDRDGIALYDPTEVNHYVVSVHHDEVEFWINDTLVVRLPTNASYAAPMLASNQPAFARVYNSGAAGSARQLSIGVIQVAAGDSSLASKPYGHIMCGNGGGAYQIQPGTASGPTVTRGASPAGWTTSGTATATGTWTATSAPATNSLGGGWVSPAISTLTDAADYPVFSYTNPAGTATLPGKTLYITGVHWGKTVAVAAASTNAIVLNYIVGIGSTTTATTVAEAAAAVAARGMRVDQIPFKATAVLGDYVEGGNIDLAAAPLVCYPGHTVQWIVRPVGTVTSNTLTVTSTVAFIGYHE